MADEAQTNIEKVEGDVNVEPSGDVDENGDMESENSEDDDDDGS